MHMNFCQNRLKIGKIVWKFCQLKNLNSRLNLKIQMLVTYWADLWCCKINVTIEKDLMKILERAVLISYANYNIM